MGAVYRSGQKLQTFHIEVKIIKSDDSINFVEYSVGYAIGTGNVVTQSE